MEKGGFSPGEIDSVTGPLIGRPKSATFRTLDVVGIDTFLHVADTVYQKSVGEEKQVFTPPPLMEEMVRRGWLGSKSGQGFYLKQGKDILELDPQTMQYHPRRKLKTAAIEQSRLEKDWGRKLKTLLYSDDRAGRLLWNIIAPVLLYSAEKLDEIAHDILSVDQAMKWGFGWELGPFEIWDALGLAEAAEMMKKSGRILPEWITDMLANRVSSFYKEENGERYFYHKGEYRRVDENPKVISLKKIKQQKGVYQEKQRCFFD